MRSSPGDSVPPALYTNRSTVLCGLTSALILCIWQVLLWCGSDWTRGTSCTGQFIQLVLANNSATCTHRIGLSSALCTRSGIYRPHQQKQICECLHASSATSMDKSPNGQVWTLDLYLSTIYNWFHFILSYIFHLMLSLTIHTHKYRRLGHN